MTKCFCKKKKLFRFLSQKYAALRLLQNIQKYFNENLVAMLNCSLSYECWSDLPSLMQAWIRTIIPSLIACYAANRHQRLAMSSGTFHSPSESIRPMDVRFCCVVPGTTPQSATRLEQNTAMRLKLLVMGYWL